MNTPPRWLAVAVFPALLLLKMSATQAFTDTNAELQELRHDRVAAARAALPAASAPVRSAWVPPSVKSLDSFQPVFRSARLAAAPGRDAVLAQARVAAPASAARQ